MAVRLDQEGLPAGVKDDLQMITVIYYVSNRPAITTLLPGRPGPGIEPLGPDGDACVRTCIEAGRYMTLILWPLASLTTARSPSVSATLPPIRLVSPMNSRNEAGRGTVVYFVRSAELLDLAVVEDGDAVGHRQRLGLIMRDEDDGQAQPAVQLANVELHLLAQLLVERAERLVHQHDLRLEYERAGERDALLLSAGKLRGPAVRERAELHHVERALDALLSLGPVDMPHS